jgi:hypothetical protein
MLAESFAELCGKGRKHRDCRYEFSTNLTGTIIAIPANELLKLSVYL